VRRFAKALLLLSGAVAVVVAAGLYAWAEVGRTPGEVIAHAKRQLRPYSTLRAWAVPVLDRAAAWLDVPDTSSRAPAFSVPPLPRNPATPAAASATPDRNDRIIRVGPGRSISRIAMAAQVAVDGSVIEIDPGDYVADVAVWTQADLTIRGTGNRVRLVAAGAHAEGKAIWVFRGHRATVENIDFIGARVPDRNGAGIRLERGQLTVRRCSFFNNQNGILTANGADIRLEVEDSDFGYNGAGDGFSHGLYAGRIDSLRLTGNHFHHGNVGHLVKSRARLNRIEYNRITDGNDGSGGRASYELELPDGGVAEVVGNVIQQGPLTRNSVIVSYGVEGYRWPQNTLRLVHNTIVNDARMGGTFVRVSPGAASVVMRNNLFVGYGKVDGSAVADAAGDRRAAWSDFRRPASLDYRLSEQGRATAGNPPPAPLQADWVPRFEVGAVVGTLPLTAPPRFAGALQSIPP